MKETYSQEEVQQILQRAFVHQSQAGEFSRSQLVEIAADLGIPNLVLQQAEREWLTVQEQDQQHLEFQRYRRGKFSNQAARYLIVNMFLVGFDLLSSHGLSWSVYVLLFWGLGLSLHGWNAFQTQGERFERAFRKWRAQQEFRQLKQEVGQTMTHLIRRGMKELRS